MPAASGQILNLNAKRGRGVRHLGKVGWVPADPEHASRHKLVRVLVFHGLKNLTNSMLLRDICVAVDCALCEHQSFFLFFKASLE